MIKTLQNIMSQDKEKFVVPKSVQHVIPIQTIWNDGILGLGRISFPKHINLRISIILLPVKKIEKLCSESMLGLSVHWIVLQQQRLH